MDQTVPNKKTNINPINPAFKSQEVEKIKELQDMKEKEIIIQPKMRFKPRTDMERIYDSLLNNYDMKEERNILIRQLEYLDLYNSKKPGDILKEDKEEENSNEEEENKKGHHGKIIDPKEVEKKNTQLVIDPSLIKKGMRKKDMNLEAKGILRVLHEKTHFKAAEEIAENKSKS